MCHSVGHQFLSARHYRLRYVLVYSCQCVSVCLSVYHTPLLYRNSCADRTIFLNTVYRFQSTHVTLCFMDRLSKIWVLIPLKLIPIWPRHTDRRQVRYKQRQRPFVDYSATWRLAGTAGVASAINSQRRSTAVDRTRRPPLCTARRSTGCE